MQNMPYKKLQALYIFVFPLANLDFKDYVRSGRWVGEVSQTRYARTKSRKIRMRGVRSGAL